MFDSHTELVTAVETALQEPQYNLSASEAREAARKLYQRTDVDANGKLHVRLATGIRIKADSHAAKLLTSELFTEVMAPQRAADLDRLVEQKRGSGHYTGI